MDPDDEYVPAEFKTGADRWRDVGVYLDGKPIAMMAWAELPVTLRPVWIRDKVSAPKRAGTDEPGWRWVRERRYRFTDYLVALGVDLRRVRQIHVYGPKFSDSIVATGADLRGRKADGFMFRFAGIIAGKPIPIVPDGFGNDRSPDKVSGVMIYVDKKPPTWERNVGFVLDGEVQTGVPYYGDPLRGGVRVYLDGRLAAYLKRQDLPVALAEKLPGGDLRWKLFDVLRAQGVAVDRIAEAWVIRENGWHERIAADELARMTFQAASQAGAGRQGHILLGDAALVVEGLVLLSTPIDPADVPKPDPDELDYL